MKGLFSAIVTFVTILIIASSCYYDNEETLYPNITPCDTANVTFSGSVRILLSNNCLSCHSNSQAAANGNNIRLELHSDVAAMAATIEGAINHLPQYSHMPKNGRKLEACLIRQFEIWRQKGSPND